MERAISWENNVSHALGRAAETNLPVLLFFHNPDCPGCRKMAAMTYPDKDVIAFVESSFIPLRIPYNAKPYADDFKIRGTPTLITLGPDKREHHRTVGFLAPEALIASGLLGIGKYHFDNDRYREALDRFDKVAENYPQSDSAAEAFYMRGMTLYKSSGERRSLKEAYEILTGRYPDSEWARRAYPYRLL